MNLDATFASAGARVIDPTTKRAALAIVEAGDLAATVGDYGWADGNSTELCPCLRSLKTIYGVQWISPIRSVFGRPVPAQAATPGVLL